MTGLDKIGRDEKNPFPPYYLFGVRKIHAE